jgi:hypothetical protein
MGAAWKIFEGGYASRSQEPLAKVYKTFLIIPVVFTAMLL